MNNSQTKLKLFNNTVIGINRSSANRSTAKSLNTFSKAQRFQKVHYPPQYLNKSKTLPNVLEAPIKMRLPTFPKADRTFYFNKYKETSEGPSPHSYQIKDQKQIWKIKRRGDAIGSKRNKTISVQKIPGPMDYEKPDLSRKSFNKLTTFYKSLRDTSQFFKVRGIDSPGPKYQPISDFILQKSKKNATVSKQQSHKARTARPNNDFSSKLNRITTQLLQKELVKPRMNSSRDSQYSSSKRPKIATITSAKRNYLSMSTSRSPGPGEYVCFSQFSGWA